MMWWNRDYNSGNIKFEMRTLNPPPAFSLSGPWRHGPTVGLPTNSAWAAIGFGLTLRELSCSKLACFFSTYFYLKCISYHQLQVVIEKFIHAGEKLDESSVVRPDTSRLSPLSWLCNHTIFAYKSWRVLSKNIFWSTSYWLVAANVMASSCLA